MGKSTRSAAVGKAVPQPKKPRTDFPFFPHATGRWAKKVRQKFVYFGKVADDPMGVAALDLWLNQRDELLAGRVPRSKIETFKGKRLYLLNRQSKRVKNITILLYCAADFEPRGEPPMGLSSGSGRPAVAKPCRYISFLIARKVGKLSG